MKLIGWPGERVTPRDKGRQVTTSDVGCRDKLDAEAKRSDERVVVCNGVEVEGGVARGQSLTQRAAKLAARWVLGTGLGNERKPRIDSVRGACRVRTFVPDCNIVVGLPG